MQSVSVPTAPLPGSLDNEPIPDRPVDLVHLARQTLNDRGVEREVLRLFLRQSAIQLARLSDARTPAERQAAAHTIVGAARAIGAWPVARIAHEVEEEAADDPSQGFARLTLAVERTTSYIRDLLGEAER